MLICVRFWLRLTAYVLVLQQTYCVVYSRIFQTGQSSVSKLMTHKKQHDFTGSKWQPLKYFCSLQLDGYEKVWDLFRHFGLDSKMEMGCQSGHTLYLCNLSWTLEKKLLGLIKISQYYVMDILNTRSFCAKFILKQHTKLTLHYSIYYL